MPDTSLITYTCVCGAMLHTDIMPPHDWMHCTSCNRPWAAAKDDRPIVVEQEIVEDEGGRTVGGDSLKATALRKIEEIITRA